jgi:hypothetical protein
MKVFILAMGTIWAFCVPELVMAGDILRLKATGSQRTDRIIDMPGGWSISEPGLFVVQWKNGVRESEKRALERTGLRILSYIPDDAFLVSGQKAMADAAAKLEFLGAVLPFRAAFKLEPEISARGIFSFADEALVSIRLAPGADKQAIRAELRDAREMGDDLLVARAEVGRLWKLAERRDIIWMERHFPVRVMALNGTELAGAIDLRATGTRTGYESGSRIMKADAAYETGYAGSGQVVAYADTGLDSGELSTLIPDFQNQVQTGQALGLGGSSWGDPHSHGTHVAGSIAGSGASSDGLIRGVGYQARLVAQGMWSDLFNNIVPPSIPKLFDEASREGATIHSNSWGAPNSRGRYDNLTVQADEWTFQHPDFLPVFAAGNDGADLDRDGVIDEGSVSSPGSAKNVLTVGASKNFLMEGGIQRKMSELRDGMMKWGTEPIASSMLSENAQGMAAFSSRGPTADGRIKPEVVAPGTNIVSARSSHSRAKPENSWGVYDDHYLYMGGTSMATPLTSGAMAVIRQFLLQKTGAESVSSALLKATVANAAEDLFPGQFGLLERGQEQPGPRPNNHQGWGRVNLENLVAGSGLTFVDDREGLATGQEREFSVQVSGSHPLKITMAYTDAPGSPWASRALVNDLDLLVRDPKGRIFYPNGRSEKDNVNNMEQIDVLKPLAGTYRIVVRGADIPQGKQGAQPFALVISAR